MTITKDTYTKFLHAFLVMLLTALSWLIVQVYTDLERDVAILDSEFNSYMLRDSTQSRSADDKLGQFMLIIEKRLENLAVRVDHLERDENEES